MRDDSGKEAEKSYVHHHEFCDGHIVCPVTGKEECSKVVNWRVMILKDGSVIQTPATVVCFGCGKPHNVTEQYEE